MPKLVCKTIPAVYSSSPHFASILTYCHPCVAKYCHNTALFDQILQLGGSCTLYHTATTPQPFYGPFSGTTRMSQCQKRTSGLYDAREDKIHRGRHTDHPAGRHSIRTNQCPPSPPPIFYRSDALAAAQPTVSKH